MKTKKTSQNIISKPLIVTIAPFWKRLFAWIYDLLGALAIFIFALLVGYLVIYSLLIPWEINGESVSNLLSQNPVWFIYLGLSVQYYYVWCWVKGGQTVGMRTWRLKLCKSDGTNLNWQEAYKRSFISLAGLSQLWCLIDSEKRGFHDIACKTYVVELPKDYNKETLPLI